MKHLLFAVVVVSVFFVLSVAAQDPTPTPTPVAEPIAAPTPAPTPECIEPMAHTFDEFPYTTAADLKTHAKDLEEKLRETNESQGIIYVFGGRKSKLNEINEISSAVGKAFTLGGSGPNSKIWIQSGGYRDVPTIVFILRPQKCSDFSAPSADLTADQVEFAEFPASTTRRVSTNDLLSTLIHAPESECPPAARAVKACDGSEVEVFVVVDTKGYVALSKANSGHPLLRAAAEAAAKKWVFKVYSEQGKPMNRSSVVIVKFNDPQEPQFGN